MITAEAIGIEKGDYVTVVTPNTPQGLFTVYAINRIGAIANTGSSIATQSAISSLTSGAIVMSGGTQYGNVYNFDNLVLPNVTNATEFVNSLDNLPNTALQVSTQRN